jgi:vacuolar-type H+-ATPase subunit F/Vma7
MMEIAVVGSPEFTLGFQLAVSQHYSIQKMKKNVSRSSVIFSIQRM